MCRCVVLLIISALALEGAFAAAAKTEREFRLESEAAIQRKDYPAALAALTAALELRPDSPRYLYNLAAVSLLTGDQPAALACLHRLAALGIFFNLTSDPVFAPLRDTPAFKAILDTLETNRTPRGRADVWAELPRRIGIIEGIAFRHSTGDLFLGDVHEHCIWKRNPAGKITRFTTATDNLLGVFGLVVDERRDTLWAATAALPQMDGFNPAIKGRAGLAELSLTTGELRRILPAPEDGRNHVFGDLALAPDGAIYVTDSAAPVIWKLAAGATALKKFAESPQFVSLQGIAIVERTLFVTDYSNGFFAVALADATIHTFAPPANTTLLGLDGLVAAPDGFYAVQNGINPQRLVHLALAPDRKSVTTLTVLAAALPGFTDLALLTTVNDRLTVIADSGWDGYDPQKAGHPSPHTVRLFQVTPPPRAP